MLAVLFCLIGNNETRHWSTTKRNLCEVAIYKMLRTSQNCLVTSLRQNNMRPSQQTSLLRSWSTCSITREHYWANDKNIMTKNGFSVFSLLNSIMWLLRLTWAVVHSFQIWQKKKETQKVDQTLIKRTLITVYFFYAMLDEIDKIFRSPTNRVLFLEVILQETLCCSTDIKPLFAMLPLNSTKFCFKSSFKVIITATQHYTLMITSLTATALP